MSFNKVSVFLNCQYSLFVTLCKIFFNFDLHIHEKKNKIENMYLYCKIIICFIIKFIFYFVLGRSYNATNIMASFCCTSCAYFNHSFKLSNSIKFSCISYFISRTGEWIIHYLHLFQFRVLVQHWLNYFNSLHFCCSLFKIHNNNNL